MAVAAGDVAGRSEAVGTICLGQAGRGLARDSAFAFRLLDSAVCQARTALSGVSHVVETK